MLFWKKLDAKVSLNLGNDIPIVKILITRSLNSNPCPEFPRSIQSLSKIGYNKMIFSLGSNRETSKNANVSKFPRNVFKDCSRNIIGEGEDVEGERGQKGKERERREG